MNLLAEKLKEIASTVLPIAVIVFLVNFTLVPMATSVLIRFIIGTVLIIIGLTLFLLGVDLGITPFGTKTGNALAKKNSLLIVVIAGLILGFFISIAEPGLLVLGGQVQEVTQGSISAISIFVVVSIGMAVMISVGFLRVFYHIQLKNLLYVIYGIIFIMAFFVSEEFLGISFDASGATTGVLAVPFILALSTGISKLRKDSIAGEDDSFGLVALASSGAIIGVMVLDILTPNHKFADDLAISTTHSNKIIEPFLNIAWSHIVEAIVSLGPLLLIYMILNSIDFKLSKRENRKILTGFAFAFIGLMIFLIGVNGGFMEVGILIGEGLSTIDKDLWLVFISFFIGVVTILAEPAVYVLTRQIEDVTSGYVKRQAVSISLALGVGLAIAMSSIRIIIPTLKLWHILLPGYIISMILTRFAPNLFIGIAFDAGGVATGPMTATFILAFIQGAANVTDAASLLTEGFGMISLVAMMPIITLQILGIIFKIRTEGEKSNA